MRYEVNIKNSDRTDYLSVRKSIQEKIDECNKNGGGVVYIPNGEYVVSSIEMRSNVTLYMEKDCILISPVEEDAFKKIDKDKNCNYNNRIFSGIITAKDCNNIAVIGGKIIGRDKDFWVKKDKIGESWCTVMLKYTSKPFRPFALLFYNCVNVTVTKITIEDSPVYSGWFVNCTNISMIKTTVLNDFYGPNTDGYHFSTCVNVLVDSCYFKTGDDSIAVDAENGGYSCDILIRNCEFDTLVNVLRLYTGLDDDLSNPSHYSRIKNLVMHNCKINNAAGVMNVTARNGDISDVEFFNLDIKMELEGTPFFFMTDNGTIDNVILKNSNVYSNGVGTIIGTKSHFIKNIFIENCNFEIKPTKKIMALDIPDPIAHYALHHFAPCNLFIRHVQNISLKNIEIKWIKNENFIHEMSAVKLLDVHHATFDGLKADAYGDNNKTDIISQTECSCITIKQ